VNAVLVSVRELEAGYSRDSAAIRGVAFEVAGGESVAVLGPNGGGKTTLFRALLGEAPHQSGEVRVEGGIAYVPQTERSRLDFPVSALDVALMGTYASLPWHRRIGKAERDRAREALRRVGLSAEEGTTFGSLSGGQRQRVLIARALARDARVVLLDEPLSGVDAVSARLVGQVLDELRAEGRALLVSTHDVAEARGADKVLCIHRDQIAFGTPAEALTAGALAKTYGSELVLLPDGSEAIVVQHHSHE